MKERFLEWGAGLSEEDFACALTAFGVLGGRNVPSRTKGALNWRFDRKLFDTSAAELAKAWRIFLEGHGGSVSIRLDRQALLLQMIDPYWLKSRLARAPGAGPIVLADETQLIGRDPVLTSHELGTDPGRGLSYSAGEETEAPSPRRKPTVKSRSQTPESRRLYAQLISLFYPVRQQLVSGALRPGKSYAARIGVGLPGPDRKDVGKPIPDLGDDAKGHDLTVIWDPRTGPGPEVQTLHLPREGDSSTVDFRFQVPADAEWFEARVTVLHANRVLQTGLLKAPVGEGEDWTFELDATPRTRLEGLDARSQFDAAIVLDQSLTAVSDGPPVVLKLDDGPLESLTDFLNHQISAIANDPKRYESLDSPGTLELFRALAIMGANLHDVLCEHQDLKRLADARRIHITSAKAESFFPIELLYHERPPSPTATLCPHARAALDAGDCTAACPSDKRQTVCPLGFWGLSRVIERHGHEPEDGKQTSGDFELRAEPVRKRNTLPVSRTALLAASDRANGADADAVGSLLQKLRQRGTAAQAATWEEWERHVAADSPGLLVLLPHHERQGGFDVLEIGDGDKLQSAGIWSEQVRRLPDGPHPLVLLIGCATNLTRVSFDNPVGRFHDKGAAVVVSTIATILGRHASPATAMLVELLDEMAATGDRTLGDVMLRLRQKLVARQTPMALGLTAYGDADWILTRKADADDRNARRPLR